MFGSVNFVDGRDLHWVLFNDEYIGGIIKTVIDLQIV